MIQQSKKILKFAETIFDLQILQRNSSDSSNNEGSFTNAYPNLRILLLNFSYDIFFQLVNREKKSVLQALLENLTCIIVKFERQSSNGIRPQILKTEILLCFISNEAIFTEKGKKIVKLTLRNVSFDFWTDFKQL